MGCCGSSPEPNTKVASSFTTSETGSNPNESTPIASDKSDNDKKQNGKNETKNKMQNEIQSGGQQQTNSAIAIPENDTNEPPSPSYSPVDDDLDGPAVDERKLALQTKLETRRSELEQERQNLENIKSQTLDDQIKKQQAQSYKGLFEIFGEHAHGDKSKMDIDGLTSALKTFGMTININKTFQRHIWSKFDLDDEKEIDYNDFMATMSSLIGTKDEDSLLLMFQIFDLDEDGYLAIEDIARILLAQNQIAVVLLGKQESAIKAAKVMNKQQCLKKARRMVEEHDSSEFNDNKISFDEFSAMMMKRSEIEMMIEHQSMPSIDIMGSVSDIKRAESQYTPGQQNLNTPVIMYMDKK